MKVLLLSKRYLYIYIYNHIIERQYLAYYVSSVRFNMRLGEGEHQTESGVRDELSDIDGKSFGWLPRVKFNDCVSHGLFKLMVEIVSVNTVRIDYIY